MKGGLYLAAALLAGALIANLLLADPGYVALRFAGHLIEMSAVTFALALLALYFLVRLLLRAINARRLWKATQRKRREERARRSLAEGVLELSEGDWENAEITSDALCARCGASGGALPRRGARGRAARRHANGATNGSPRRSTHLRIGARQRSSCRPSCT